MSVVQRSMEGLRYPHKALKEVSGRVAASTMSSIYDNRAVNVFGEDWDVLILLDACRVDALAEVAPDYDFLPDEIPHVVSVGSGSPQWMANTFTDEWREEIRDTGYVSGNPHARRVLSDSMHGRYAEIGGAEDWLEELAYFVPVWESGWDAGVGTVPARAVTDHLVHNCRSRPTRRVIAHYMQPHFPSVPRPLADGIDLENDAGIAENVWSKLGDGLTVEAIFESYLENLRYVLDDVEVALANIDAETVVISADHGEAFGEYLRYGHGKPYIGAVRNVPWVRTSATDEGGYAPDVGDPSKPAPSVDEQLQALGYT